MLWLIALLLVGILVAVLALNSTVANLYRALRRAGRAKEDDA